jgi:hypothetical protein
MSVKWEIRSSILLVTLAGEYGFEEPKTAIMEGMAESQFHKGTSLLIDASLSKSNRSSEEFHKRALWMASLREKGLSSRCAIVINGRLHQLGMARMASTHLDLRGSSNFSPI